VSLGRDYYLVCDPPKADSRQQQCSYSSTEEARRAAASAGWERVFTEVNEALGYVRRGDLCPQCARARARGEIPRQLALEEAV
jgi:hypothetical protein